MTSPAIDPPDDVLESWLRDLGANLDLGSGETPERRSALVTAVLDGLDDRADDGVDDPADDVVDDQAGHGPDDRADDGLGDRADDGPDDAADDSSGDSADDVAAGPTWAVRSGRGFRSHRILAAAAIVIVALAVLLAVAPAREAIADWFGIGSVRITRSDAPPSTGQSPDPTTTPLSSIDLDDLAGVLPFEARLPDPDRYGQPLAVYVDPEVPTGLVELRYEAFSLVEVASRPDELPVFAKELGPGTELTGVTVRGVDGVWLAGDVHEVMTIRPDGEVAVDTLRRAGDVLLWEEDGVTYRIEGLDSLDAALDVASSID
jgi:hypothetical protein